MPSERRAASPAPRSSRKLAPGPAARPAPRPVPSLGLLAGAASLAVAAWLASRLLVPVVAPPAPSPEPPAIPQPDAPLPATYAGLAEESLRLARFVGRLPGSSPRATALRGAILAEAGDHSGAADAWREHLAVRGDSAEARYRLGILATREGKDAEAAVLLGEALERDPSLPDIRGHLGRALLKLDRVDEAAAVLEVVPADDRGGAVRLFHLGHARLRQGRDAEALEAFRGAVEAAPAYTGAWYGLATAAARLGQDDRASEAREEFRRLKTSDAEAAAANLERDEGERLRALLGRWYAAAGKAAFDAGELGGAEACLRRGLALVPDSAELREGLDAVARRASARSPAAM